MDRRFDYIVVFGAAVRPDGAPSAVLRHRVELAHRLANGRSDVRFLVTGGVGTYPPAEAEVMRRALIGLGVPPEAIETEPEGHDTLSSALLCAGILERRADVRSITLCSSSFHLLRCRLLFRALGLKTRDARLPSDRRLLGLRAWLRASLREVPAIPWDLMLAGRHRLGAGQGGPSARVGPERPRHRRR